MKNQYFGDVNDYKKYGILRILQKAFPDDKIAICWMLTPDDGSSDGKKLGHFNNKKNERRCDPDLFDLLHKSTILNKQRSVSEAEEIFPADSVVFFKEIISDDMKKREQYFSNLKHSATGCKLMFFDPDIGIAPASIIKGRKDSSMYIYSDEIKDFYGSDKSVLIYQHFPRIERTAFIENTAKILLINTGASDVVAFRTSHVVYFLLVAENKSKAILNSCNLILDKWNGFIIVDHFSH
jgi:hypothetical protein